MPTEHNYDRADLVALCEAALVPIDRWRGNRAGNSQHDVGACWALLKDGCPFVVLRYAESPDSVYVSVLAKDESDERDDLPNDNGFDGDPWELRCSLPTWEDLDRWRTLDLAWC